MGDEERAAPQLLSLLEGAAQEAAEPRGDEEDVVLAVVQPAALVAREQVALERVLDVAQRAVAEVGQVGHDAEERDAPSLHHDLAHLLADLRHLLGHHLVQHDPAHLDALVREHLPVHLELVEGLAQPAVGHEDHIGADQRGRLRVGELDDAAHPNVPGSLDEDHVARRALRRKRAADRLDLRVRVDLGVDVA